MTYTIQGHEITMPVRVRDATAASALFLVRPGPAQALIAECGLEVARPVPGRAICSLAFVRYVDGDLGPYHEVAVAILVRVPPEVAAGRRAVGAFIHRLPVDQALTLEAGRTIWGFPKYRAGIELDFTGRAARATLREDRASALTLEVRRGVPMPGRGANVDAYSFRDGVLRRTAWSLTPSGSRGRVGGASVTVGEGETADELRRLGLPRRAAFTSTIARMEMQFGSAEIVR